MLDYPTTGKCCCREEENREKGRRIEELLWGKWKLCKPTKWTVLNASLQKRTDSSWAYATMARRWKVYLIWGKPGGDNEDIVTY